MPEYNDEADEGREAEQQNEHAMREPDRRKLVHVSSTPHLPEMQSPGTAPPLQSRLRAGCTATHRFAPPPRR